MRSAVGLTTLHLPQRFDDLELQRERLSYLMLETSMWQRIANSPARFSIVVAGVCAVLTTTLVIAAHIQASIEGADSPLWKIFLGGFLFDVWLMAPYLGVCSHGQHA